MNVNGARPGIRSRQYPDIRSSSRESSWLTMGRSVNSFRSSLSPPFVLTIICAADLVRISFHLLLLQL